MRSPSCELDDDYRLAVSRWLLGMTPDTDRELIRHAERHHEPYVLALATVRLAIDTAGDEPPSADDALHAAETIAPSYDSQYIRDYAMAARGVHARVFGDLSVALDAGQRLLDSPAPLMQAWGFWHLAVAGLLGRDEAALTTALGAAQHAAARQVPGAAKRAAVASCWLGLLAATPWTPVRRSPSTIRGSHRDLVDRGDVTAARSAVGSSKPVAPPARPWPTPSAGSRIEARMIGMKRCGWPTSTDSDLIAVDALEALAAIAAANDSFTEALRLLAAADRLAPRPVTSGATSKSSAPMRGTRRRTSERRRGGGHRLAGKASRSTGSRPPSTHDGHGANGAGPSMVGPASPRPSSGSSTSSPRG